MTLCILIFVSMQDILSANVAELIGPAINKTVEASRVKTDPWCVFELAGKRSAAEVMQLIGDVHAILALENLCGKGHLAETIPATRCSPFGEEYFVDSRIVYLPPRGRVIFVGDTHADSISTERVVRQTRFIETMEEGREETYLVFLGDYIDRGSNNIRNLEIVLGLKKRYSNNVVLMMGNHETGLWFPTNFVSSVMRHFQSSNEKFMIIQDYEDLFWHLPVVLVTGNGIVAVHGGVPVKPIKTLQGLRNSETLFEEIRGNDPTNVVTSYIPSRRGSCYEFGESVFENFMKAVGGTVMIRSHEDFPEGYRLFFHNRLVTVFSSGGTSKESEYRRRVHPKYIVASLEEPIDAIETEKHIRGF